MKTVITFLLILLSAPSLYSQEKESAFTLNSSLCRIYLKDEAADTLKQSEAWINHLIVLNRKKRRVFIYNKTIEFELAILDEAAKELKGGSMVYTLKCLNANTLKECEVIVRFEKKEAFLVQVIFDSGLKFDYFVDPA